MNLGCCLTDSKPSRQLVILMSWMLAKEHHIEKYRKMYYNRGFDVLTCKTSPYDLLVPPDGVQKNVKHLIKYLDDHVLNVYPDVIIHAFSVGAYVWGELIVELYKKKTKSQIENGIQQHIKGKSKTINSIDSIESKFNLV